MWKDKCKIIYEFRDGRLLVVTKEDCRFDDQQVVILDSKTAQLALSNKANWKTINGSHVLVGKGGRIIAGMGGKFDKVPSSSGWAKQCAEEKARVLGLKPNYQALYVLDNGGASEEECLAAMRDGKTRELVENYFQKMKENGDPTPTKALARQEYVGDDVSNGKYKSYKEARLSYIKSVTDMNDREAETTLTALTEWVGGSGFRADQKVLDNYIEKAPTFDGKIYRGLRFRTSEEYNKFMENVRKNKPVGMKGCSSWSNRNDVARLFAGAGDDYLNSVVLTCVKNKTATPIDFANTSMESEVLAHSRTRWTVLHYNEYPTRNGATKAYVTVVEKGEYADD